MIYLIQPLINVCLICVGVRVDYCGYDKFCLLYSNSSTRFKEANSYLDTIMNSLYLFNLLSLNSILGRDRIL